MSLDVADELVGLPLLELAEDVAARFTRLVVATARLPEATGGAMVALRPAGAAIVVDTHRVTDADDQAAAFAHELAHLLDRQFEVSNEGTRELFARRLAPLLLVHEPTTVAEVDELRQRRYGFDHLERLMGCSASAAPTREAARRLGVTRRTVARLRAHGLTEEQADHYACRAGFHPGVVWKEWCA